MQTPTITFPTLDLSGALDYLNQALTSVVVPNIGYIIAAAAIVGAVSWVVYKGTHVVRLH